MIRVPPAEVSFRIWETGYDLIAFLVAKAAPALSLKFTAACTEALNEDVGRPLPRLTAVMDKAATYDEDDIAYLDYQERLVLAYPFSRWDSLKDLQELLCSQRLIGFGFIHPRGPTSAPTPIPGDLWKYDPDWEASTLQGNGMAYVAVRICTAASVNEALATVSAPAPRNVGRPSVKRQIHDAFHALVGAGKVAPDQSMARLYEPIRQWLQASYPENSGYLGNLSDETIRKAITDDFKALRDSSSQ